jgi:hypothetical protein
VRTFRPAAYLTIAVLIAAVAVTQANIVATLLGAVTTVVTLRIGTLVGAFVLRVRVHKVVIGLGPRIIQWGRVVIRALPVSLTVGVLRSRPRYLGTAVASVLFGVAMVVVLHGDLALGAAATVLLEVLTFRWPRAGQPGVVDVFDLVQAGRLDEAERLVGRLNAEHPKLRTVKASRVLVLEARGRYSEALTLAIGMSDEESDREAANTMAAVAGLTGAAVEAGQLTASDGLPVAARALNEAIQLGRPSHMMDGVRALLALLAGDPQLAVRLARLACQNDDDSLSRADDLATLARAYMAAGDNSAARRALAQAERLVPWWPRVALTRRRLDLA